MASYISAHPLAHHFFSFPAGRRGVIVFSSYNVFVKSLATQEHAASFSDFPSCFYGRFMDGLVDSHDMCQTKSFLGFGHN